MFLGTGIAETLIDLTILILPVRVVFALHLPMRTRMAVAGIFALGGFAIITNIVRIQYTYQPHKKYGIRPHNMSKCRH
jgi:hydrogenase/urease accessory protein HupE